MWVARSAAIDISIATLNGVDRLAQTGQDGIARLDTTLTRLNQQIAEVESAANQISQNVQDQGLVSTLLPSEKEERLQATVEQVSDGLTNIREVIQSALELAESINRLPFVDLPMLEPERVQALEEGLNSIRNGVAELKTDLQQFRERASTGISKISASVSALTQRLEGVQENLGRIDSWLADWQAKINQLKQTIPTLITISAVVISLLLGWIIYALVSLIQRTWSDLRS
jgi:chromosome segregation ATPase